ncbi:MULTISPECIES: ATP-binding protein [unclassified Cryobacterium]|uniref:sensor histidine kinase n=1 Tax=unclassified Cryobacterium TaxID=2649013 RepID=UPI00141A7A96|nr:MULTISPECIES: ATP-binding protein [unclassified Cryobacterium]
MGTTGPRSFRFPAVFAAPPLSPAGHPQADSRGAEPDRRMHALGAWAGRSRLTIAAWLVGLAVTSALLWSPAVVFGFRNPSAHLVLDSVDACVALLVASLVFGRFLRHGRLQDLLLFQGLVLLAAAGLGLTYLTEVLGGIRAGTLDIWLPLAIRVVGALLILAAALAHTRPAKRMLRRRLLALAPLPLVAAVYLALWTGRDRLPVAFDPGSAPVSAENALLTGHPVLLLAQGAAAVSFFIASVAFASQSAKRDDELLRWLGPACALGAFARLNYVLFPSLYTDWLYTGDLLRTGCYLLLLVGAAREIRTYWRAQVTAAVLDDRRRLARELHDGVIQELAYIRAESHAIPVDVASGIRIVNACDRALDEARAAVQALGRTSDEPLSFTVHRAATELAARYGIDLRVDLDEAITVDSEQQHALMRITREAVSNAVHHGKAMGVHIRLSEAGGRRRLAIADDGVGFDVPAGTDTTGYGLVSMQARARALPGTFKVEARPAGGSVVTVQW